MCGRYVSPREAEIERFYRYDRRSPQPFSERYNVAPTTLVPIIYQAEDGAKVLDAARWGLVPHWWKDAKPPTRTISARSEDAAGKPMWRHSFAHCRCLMPSKGWYEWRKLEAVDKTTGEVRTVKRPYYFCHASEPVFAFAGLLASRRQEDESTLVSCALLTQPASPGTAYVHDRMPVVLSPEDLDKWLDPEQHEETAQKMVERSQAEFVSYPVSLRVNNTANDSPELIEEVPLTV